MEIFEYEILFDKHRLVMTNQRVLYWPDLDTLILSDLHLGKAAHFRKNGIAIPSNVQEQDLLRLSRLIKYYKIARIILVGDLLHAGENKEVERFKVCMQSLPEVEIVLIKGNHDRISDARWLDLGIHQVYDEHIFEGVHFVHTPTESLQGTFISGHIHPGVVYPISKWEHIRMPAYIVTPNQIILPAYSQFTGLDTSFKITDASYYPFFEKGIFKL